jgi:type IV pilus assembly protein PilE
MRTVRLNHLNRFGWREGCPKNLGFTLIELMIAVAIVAILAAIAFPSYQDQVRKTRRGDAQGVLLELAQWMERYYTANNTYTGAVLPFNQSPKEGDSKYYNISLSTLAANNFTLTAAPIASTGQDKDKCGSLTYTSTGKKGKTGSLPLDRCW